MPEETTSAAQPSQVQPTPPASTGNGTASDPKTTAMLAWIFAPFTSYLFKDESDPFVKSHARESFYLGIANIAVLLVLGVINICVSAVFYNFLWSAGLIFAQILSCLWALLWLGVVAFIAVPRIMGLVKANNHEEWKVPYVTEYLSKYIKF